MSRTTTAFSIHMRSVCLSLAQNQPKLTDVLFPICYLTLPVTEVAYDIYDRLGRMPGQPTRLSVRLLRSIQSDFLGEKVAMIDVGLFKFSSLNCSLNRSIGRTNPSNIVEFLRVDTSGLRPQSFME